MRKSRRRTTADSSAADSRDGSEAGPEAVRGEASAPNDSESTPGPRAGSRAERAAGSAEPPRDEPEPVSAPGQDFGTWLRLQREGRGIELHEIADASKISMRYLEAMESNRFGVLPASIFTKGFLRQYAGYVGLDPEEVVNFYLDTRRDEEEAVSDEVVPPRRRRRSRAENLRYVVAALVLAVLLLGVVWLVSYFSEASGSEPVGDLAPAPSEPAEPSSSAGPTSGDDSPAGGSLEPRAPGTAPGERAVADRPAGSTEVAETPADLAAPIRVTLDFSGDCWVEADVDGRREVAEMHVQGSSLLLTADERVDLKVGDIGSVRLEVNGIPYRLEPVVAETAVRRISIDLETVARLEAGQDPAPRRASGEE